MKFLIVPLLFTAVSAVSIVPYGIVPECAGKPQGTKLVIGSSGCTQYAICQPTGLSFIETCQPGLVYNAPKDICDWPQNVPWCLSQAPSHGGQPEWQPSYNQQYQQQQQYYPQQNYHSQQNHYPQQNRYPQRV